MKKDNAVRKPIGIVAFLAITYGIMIGSNLVMVQLAKHLSSYILPKQDENLLIDLQVSPFVMFLSFILPFLLGLLYILPILRDLVLRQGTGEPIQLAGKRLLTAPLILALTSILGWIIDYIGFYCNAIVGGTGIAIRETARFFLQHLAIGFLTFVLSYYILDIIYSRFFIPRYFGNARLSRYKGAFSLSIGFRFAIHFFASVFVPIFIISLFVTKVALDMGEVGIFLYIPYFSISTTFIFVSILLTIFLSRTFRRPLLQMRQHTELVRAGNFEDSIEVVSIDELGRLGEALNDMTAGLKERERIRETFGKAVDPRVRDHLLSGDSQRGGTLNRASILFCDIRGFTTIAEGMDPAMVVSWLNRYFERMSACIAAEGGVVNKYIGDAIMAVFGVPVELANHEAAALRAAVAMRTERERLNKELDAEGYPHINAGIGIHTGMVMAGTIGSSERMEYTVIGDTVNIAARIEKLCKTSGKDLLVSETCAQALKDSKLTFLGAAVIRGKTEKISVYWA